MSLCRSDLVLVCDCVQFSSNFDEVKTILGLSHSQAQSQSQTQHVPYVPLNHCHPATVGHWHQRPILERHGPLERVETSLSAGRAQVQARARRGAVFLANGKESSNFVMKLRNQLEEFPSPKWVDVLNGNSYRNSNSHIWDLMGRRWASRGALRRP